MTVVNEGQLFLSDRLNQGLLQVAEIIPAKLINSPLQKSSETNKPF